MAEVERRSASTVPSLATNQQMGGWQVCILIVEGAQLVECAALFALRCPGYFQFRQTPFVVGKRGAKCLRCRFAQRLIF